jgi:hypothetical protein
MIGMQLLDLESLLRNEDAILRPKHLSTIPAHLISPKIQNTSTFTSVVAHNIHSKKN